MRTIGIKKELSFGGKIFPKKKKPPLPVLRSKEPGTLHMTNREIEEYLD